MTTNVQVWSSVKVDVQSALSASIPISAVTKANPGVATYTGTDVAVDGNALLLSAVGMQQINGRVIRADSVDTGANTLALEGEDTTGYGTFVSGDAKVVTLGNPVQSFVDVSASGGEYKTDTVATIHDDFETEFPTIATALKYQFTSIWDVSDATLIDLRNASRLKQQRVVSFGWGSGSGVKMLFNAYVGTLLAPGGSAQGKVTCTVLFSLTGAPTYYAV